MEEIPASLTQQRERLLDLIDGIIAAIVEESCPANKPPEDWDWKGIRAASSSTSGRKPPRFEHLHDVRDLAHDALHAGAGLLEEREKEMGTELLMRVFRHFYLEDIDKQWVEHLTNMEHLRDGIGLRGYGQRDPKQEYKKEGYDIFVNMMAATTSNVVTKLMRVRLQKESEIERLEREDYERHEAQPQSLQLRHGGELDGEGRTPAEPAHRSAVLRHRRPQRPWCNSPLTRPEDWPQRSLPLRQRREVQEVPRRRPRRRERATGRRRRKPVASSTSSSLGLRHRYVSRRPWGKSRPARRHDRVT